jgi:hypothetical protein
VPSIPSSTRPAAEQRKHRIAKRTEVHRQRGWGIPIAGRKPGPTCMFSGAGDENRTRVLSCGS